MKSHSNLFSTFLILLANIAFTFATSRHASDSRFMTYKGLAMAGYQGWFNAPDDGAGRGWNHYTKDGKFYPGMCTIDMWPDMTEYKVKYKTPFVFADGSPAFTFSSYDKSTTDLHFRWMREYGIDGVFMQRFVASIRTPIGRNHTNTVLRNALDAAEVNNRSICVMYDLSGMRPYETDLVIADWKALVDSMKLTSRPNSHYLYHRTKPLVAIWGVGFGDGRKYGYPEFDKLLRFFKEDPEYGGCSVLLGVPTRWRELGSDSDKNSQLHEVIKKADIVQPWLVNRFTQETYPNFHELIAKDLQWCKANGLDYVPVLFPGFSWHNGGSLESFGSVNTADSLAAIKKMVFDEKLISAEKLIEILDANFVSFEKEHKLLKSCPKYGNDDAYADDMMVQLHDFMCNNMRDQRHRTNLDWYFNVLINNKQNTILGRWVGASADGRKAGREMANGNTPAGENDKEGITALINSLVKPSHSIHAGAVQNMRFGRDFVTNDRPKFDMLIDTYFKKGGSQAMITVINRGELEKALLEPELYTDLYVRIGGFSARYIDLPRDVQLEILSRVTY